ncbi:MAG: hypothetical protein J2P31_01555 [Blastocatellia bacterium]|nr:hypothetical protein [Blastocatellia bacterium]
MTCSCTSPRQVTVNTPQGRETNYPPTYEPAAGRVEEIQEAWRKFLVEAQLPFSRLDLEPVFNTPRSLPAELVGRINLLAKKSDAIGEMKAKEAVREFLERTSGIFGGDPRDLSLISFSSTGKSYNFVYQQANYTFPLASGYGELRVEIDKAGRLLALSSSIVPKLDLPTSPSLHPEEFVDKLIGREFSYTTIAGQLQTYRIAKREEITVDDPVVYPKRQGDKLTIHLAYPVVVGNEMTWTVFIDAIDGEEVAVNQNFAS